MVMKAVPLRLWQLDDIFVIHDVLLAKPCAERTAEKKSDTYQDDREGVNAPLLRPMPTHGSLLSKTNTVSTRWRQNKAYPPPYKAR